MQNSELFRRGFVVPLNWRAEKALSNSNVDENTEVHFYELSNEEVFEELWEAGLFILINEQLGVMIDDYEEEKIEPQFVASLKIIVKQFEESNEIEAPGREAVLKLIGLCDIAIKHKSSLFFIL